MRWKIGSRDRDSRQIDLIVVLALLIVILAAFRFYNGPQAEHHRLYRAKPNRSVVSCFEAHQNLGTFSANPL